MTPSVRRHSTLALLLSVALAACTGVQSATFDAGKGARFIPQVVDWPMNVGIDPSVSVSSDGRPFISYLGYVAPSIPGKIPDVRTLAYPQVPNVMYATQTGGVWSLSGIAKATVKAGPLQGLANLTTTSPTTKGGGTTGIADAGQASAVDATTAMVQAVWTDTSGLEYSAQSSSGFSKPKLIAKGTNITGESIGLDASGHAWVAWIQGNSLMVGSSSGASWSTSKVASTGSCHNCPGVRTATDVGPSGSVSVAYSDGTSPMVATFDGSSWSTTVVQKGDGGFGISMVLDRSGNYHMAYYGNGVVRHGETSPDGWIVSDLAKFSPTLKGYSGWATSIAVDTKGDTYVAWYDPAQEAVEVMADTAGAMKGISTPGTGGGQSPSVAVTPDGSTMYLAWYAPLDASTGQGGNLMVGTYGANPGLALAASPASQASSAPSTGSPPPSTGPCTSGKVLNLIAPPGASGSGFKETKLTAPAGKCFTIKFDNQDAGIAHNVAVYTDTTATTALAPPGAMITGPATETVVVPALQAGSYFYRCDVHPTIMTGTLVVK